MLEVESCGVKHNVAVKLNKYIVNDNLAIKLFEPDEGPFATITINLGDLPEGCAYIDTNNCPWATDLIRKYNLGTFTGITTCSGYCTYPLYYMNIDELEKYRLEGF